MRAGRSSTLPIVVSTEARRTAQGSLAARYRLRRNQLLRVGRPGGPAYRAGRVGDLDCPGAAAGRSSRDWFAPAGPMPVCTREGKSPTSTWTQR